MKGRLQDRVAIIAGGGSSSPGWGNGKATAVLFAREGAKVFVVDISEEAANETVELIRSEGGTATSHRSDVSNSDAVAALVSRCLSIYGRVDVLHYNVGIVKIGGCVELSEDDWHLVLNTNLTGCFLLCKHVLPIMERQGRGVVLTTGSIAGIRWTGVPYIAYSTTKAALVQFTRSVAMQYARAGIRAACILPGLMDTPMIYRGLPDAYASGDARHMVEMRNAQCPTGRMGNAWDVAYAAAFLASDEAKYITATELLVDGGTSAKFC
jgi:NAD(P)-dependent dehydrogenase (short-subunit alcohol dehydrogenase family)